jgi:hypothetical protein
LALSDDGIQHLKAINEDSKATDVLEHPMRMRPLKTLLEGADDEDNDDEPLFGYEGDKLFVAGLRGLAEQLRTRHHSMSRFL